MGIIITLVILAVILLTIIAIYNRLVGLRQNCRQGLADIDAQLTQRHDLIPNLVETVKGYASHEKATLDAVTAARTKAMGATGTAAAAAEGELSGALKSLFALAENYPDLKASANFQTLQHELSDVENKLAASRRALNAAVADYNGAIQAFPAVLFAGALGFREENFSRIADADRAVVAATPEVKF